MTDPVYIGLVQWNREQEEWERQIEREEEMQAESEIAEMEKEAKYETPASR